MMIEIFSNLLFGVPSLCICQPGVNGVTHAVYTTVRHCESQPRKYLSLTQLIVAAFTKQSSFMFFAAKSVKEDCFVAGQFAKYYQCNTLALFTQHTPRNDEINRISESASTQTQKFKVTHILSTYKKLFATFHEVTNPLTHRLSKLRLLKGDLT
jgi:hypothetical protein